MRGILFLIFVITIIPILGNSALAETFTINIPTGTSNLGCEKNDACYLPYEITISPGDMIEWTNGDDAAHTVTSGTVTDGPDELFDSSLFGPGKSFSHQFTNEGTYEYFCLVHPWMKGVVNVGTSLGIQTQTIHNVGAEVDENEKGYDVEYTLKRNLVSGSVDTEKNTITFILSGNAVDDELVIGLPEGLIFEPNTVWIDGNQLAEFDSKIVDNKTILTISLQENTEEVIILGTSVVPEFGVFSVVLVVATISMIAITKNRILVKP